MKPETKELKTISKKEFREIVDGLCEMARKDADKFDLTRLIISLFDESLNLNSADEIVAANVDLKDGKITVYKDTQYIWAEDRK